LIDWNVGDVNGRVLHHAGPFGSGAGLELRGRINLL